MPASGEPGHGTASAESLPARQSPNPIFFAGNLPSAGTHPCSLQCIYDVVLVFLARPPTPALLLTQVKLWGWGAQPQAYPQGAYLGYASTLALCRSEGDANKGIAHTIWR
jgi:hypothetical protein